MYSRAFSHARIRVSSSSVRRALCSSSSSSSSGSGSSGSTSSGWCSAGWFAAGALMAGGVATCVMSPDCKKTDTDLKNLKDLKDDALIDELIQRGTERSNHPSTGVKGVMARQSIRANPPVNASSVEGNLTRCSDGQYGKYVFRINGVTFLLPGGYFDDAGPLFWAGLQANPRMDQGIVELQAQMNDAGYLRACMAHGFSYSNEERETVWKPFSRKGQELFEKFGFLDGASCDQLVPILREPTKGKQIANTFGLNWNSPPYPNESKTA